MLRAPQRAALLATLLLVSSTAACDAPPSERTLTVFAAASLADVAEDLADAFAARQAAAGEPVTVTLNVAGSNTLARQIRASRVGDVFLSADGRWVDAVEAAGRTLPGSRRPILGNRLVLVARPGPAGGPIDLTAADLAGAPFERLALADPEAVPAGRYARAALEALVVPGAGSAWDAVADRLVPTTDVRAALALARANPRVWAVVYATDMAAGPGLAVLAEIPSPPGAEITYWAVALDGPEPETARRFVAFLGSDEALETAARHGFPSPPGRFNP